MKARIIIDEEFQDVEVESFEVSYNKYKDVDVCVIVTSKDGAIEIVGKESKKEAVGVAKPSSAGIVDEDNMFEVDIPVATLFEGDNKPSWVLIERQRAQINWCRPDKKKEDLKIIEENRVIKSDVFTFPESNIIDFTNTIKQAISQVVKREKVFAGDYFLYATKEPVVTFGEILENNIREFYVIEEVTKVQLITETEGESLENNDKDA